MLDYILNPSILMSVCSVVSQQVLQTFFMTVMILNLEKQHLDEKNGRKAPHSWFVMTFLGIDSRTPNIILHHEYHLFTCLYTYYLPRSVIFVFHPCVSRYSLGVCQEEMKQELHDYLPPLEHWAKEYLSSPTPKAISFKMYEHTQCCRFTNKT